MTIRNERYPELGDNNLGRCWTCGSDCPNGECPRDCQESGPSYTVDGKPMPPVWVAMSHELGTTRWLSSDRGMRSSIEYWTGYYQEKLPERQPALTHLQNRLRELGLDA